MHIGTENPALYIEQLAKDAGVHIDDACEAAGVSRSTITRWKNESTAPKFETFIKLQDAIKRLRTIEA